MRHAKLLLAMLLVNLCVCNAAYSSQWTITSVVDNAHYDVNQTFVISGTADWGIDYAVAIYGPDSNQVFLQYCGRADAGGNFSFSINPASNGCYGSTSKFTICILYWDDPYSSAESGDAFHSFYFDDNNNSGSGGSGS